ncbi:MAG: ABC transporter ATP-binding protein [Candidatus Omnitrophica bacterium]|nr:ABC transporter ATP-binding protein [Candidatus Omnitrophota bacterium]
MIDIIDLYKMFEKNQVLCGLDLQVQTGETLVIIGRSGCGKSVLLKHIMGLMYPEKGAIHIDDQDVFLLDTKALNSLRLKIGMLFQGSALFDSLTVGENVGFFLSEHTHINVDEIKDIVAEKLQMVGLEGIENLKPAELSGGMKKRVALARAICYDPEIILYDEPTTGLDPIMADAINDLIVELHRKLKVTSIVVTHDMASAYKVADRIAMLYEGKIVEIGTPDEIKKTSNEIVQQFITGSAEGPITHNQKRYIKIKPNNKRMKK